MIEHRDGIVKHKECLENLKIVFDRALCLGLKIFNGIIAEIADSAANKRRKSRGLGVEDTLRTKLRL
jgi:hypothetical protein